MNSNTNTIRALCPKCEQNIPKLELTADNIVKVDCSCGNKQDYPLSEYIKLYNDTPNRKVSYVNKCKEHNQLLNYYCPMDDAFSVCANIY